MKLRQFNAVRATIEHLSLLYSKGIRVVGENQLENLSFCQLVNMTKAKKRLISCSNIDIRGIEYYYNVELRIIEWMKQNIRLPTNRTWCNMASPSAWLHYNFAQDLYIIHLSIAFVHYYICVREEYVRYYRQIAFGSK